MWQFRWILGRFLIPITVAAATPLFVQLFHKNPFGLDLLPAFLPCLVVLLHLILSASAAPKLMPAEANPQFDNAINLWRVFDIGACLVLMAFEMVMGFGLAFGSSEKALFIGLVLFAAYTLLSIIARRSLLGAFEVLAAETIAGKKLVKGQV